MANNRLLELLVLLTLSLVVSAQSFYGTSGAVIDLDPDTFEDRVLNSRQLSVVEFYAPWCPHCRDFTGEYKKAAKLASPLVNFYGVNCDEERNKPLCGKYGIQSLPSIKIVKPVVPSPDGKKKSKQSRIEDYGGNREAKALAKSALDQIPNSAVLVTKNNIARFVERAQDYDTTVVLLPKRSQSGVPALYKQLSNQLTVPKQLVFAYVSAEHATELASQVGITNDESKSQLFIYNNGKFTEYEGEMKIGQLSAFLSQYKPKNIDKGEKKKRKKATESAGASGSAYTDADTDSSSASSTVGASTGPRKPRLVEERTREKAVKDHYHPEYLEDDDEVPAEEDVPELVSDHSDSESDQSEPETDVDSDTEATDVESEEEESSTMNPWKRVRSFAELKEQCLNGEDTCFVLVTSVYNQIKDFKTVNTARTQVDQEKHKKFRFVHIIDFDDETQHIAEELGFPPFPESSAPSTHKGPAHWNHKGAFGALNAAKGWISKVDGELEVGNVKSFITSVMDGQVPNEKKLPKRYLFKQPVSAKEDL
ncbi:hypothetical protein TRVA0_012S01090 [Trichomonascus vanleenenianus]|uniref:protein disulfide isomerase MPD1 n=1 Tax=Trichomonascus vanleenenianus TaxID=2268995 RepID=UPI003ECAEB5A